MTSKLLLCVLFVLCSIVRGFFRPNIVTVPLEEGADCGDPLFLTPLLKEGKIKEAQNKSLVTPQIGDDIGYSGFFTVNKNCGSNLFFWFFPARNDWKNAPVLLWLQGGPGSSSMFGLFEELGPYISNESGLKKRKYSWNVYNNLLFIDQPVGTGYSFTNDSSCYPTNETTVGADLYSALIQFFTLFPNLQENKFFVSGESYAGKYIPAVGYTIHQNNPTADTKINLLGLFIGDGWCDPVSQCNYGDYLYQLGLLDIKGRHDYCKAQKKFVQEVNDKDYESAVATLDSFTGELYSKYIGNVSVYNYLIFDTADLSYWPTFVQTTKIRQAIHVGNLSFSTGDVIYDKLELDMVQSVKPWVEILLEQYDMFFYNGQLDIICAYPLTENFLRSLIWSGADVYKKATRYKWTVDNETAGYFKRAGHLTELMIRDAGHMVPADQPEWAFNMINMLTGVFNNSFVDQMS